MNKTTLEYMTDAHIVTFCKDLSIKEECEFRKCLAVWRSKIQITPLFGNKNGNNLPIQEQVYQFAVDNCSVDDKHAEIVKHQIFHFGK